MILPLKRARNRWIIDWFDFTEPVIVPALGEFCLPTCILVVAEGSYEIIGTDLLREIDQRKCERFLGRLLDSRGTPDEFVVAREAVWDGRLWQSFAESCQTTLLFKSRGAQEVAALFQQVEQVKAALADRLTQAARENTHAAGGFHVVAESLVRAARKVATPGKRHALLEKAVEWEPRCYDALLELADLQFDAGDGSLAVQFYQRVLEITHGSWQDRQKLDWEEPEMRAALRAQYGMMMLAWQQGDLGLAIEQGGWLLEVNPWDHQGVRFYYPLLFLLNDQPEEAVAYFDEYAGRFVDDFHEPGFYFGWALALALADREAEAARLYAKGMARNLHIAPLLLDLPEPSREIHHANDRAEMTYALEFFDSFGVLWERESAALRGLREVYETGWPHLESLWRIRADMQSLQDQRYDQQHEKRWAQLVEREQETIKLLDNFLF